MQPERGSLLRHEVTFRRERRGGVLRVEKEGGILCGRGGAGGAGAGCVRSRGVTVMPCSARAGRLSSPCLEPPFHLIYVWSIERQANHRQRANQFLNNLSTNQPQPTETDQLAIQPTNQPANETNEQMSHLTPV